MPDDALHNSSQVDPVAPSAASEGHADQTAEHAAAFLNQVQQQLDSLRGLIAENSRRQSEVLAKDDAVKRREAVLDAREQDLLARARAFDEQMQSQSAALDQVATGIDERVRAAKAESDRIVAAQHELESRERALAEREKQAKSREEDVAARGAHLAEREANLAAAEARAAQAGDAGASELARAREQLAAAQAQSASTAEAAKAELAEILALAEAAERRAAQLEAELAAAKQSTARGDELATKAAEVERALAEAEGRAGAARAEAQTAQQLLAAAREDAGRMHAELDARTSELRKLGERLRELEAATTERAADDVKRAELDEESSAVVAQASAVLERAELRRLRLAKYKRLLGGQSAKIVKAKAALQKKAGEADAVIAQRAKLSEAFAELEARKREIEVQASKGKALAAVMYCFITLVAVTGLAWGISGQFAPGTFAARAELAADGKGRELEQHELVEWTEQQKALLADPQVMAAAAENFARRGMQGLGTAAAVKQRFAGIYTQSSKPGSLTVESTGQGADRSARELETFLSAVVSVSGTQRDTRGDGAATIISKAPVSTGQALDQQRLIVAGAIGGGGLALAGIIGAAAYRSLRRARDQFEQQAGEASAMV